MDPSLSTLQSRPSVPPHRTQVHPRMRSISAAAPLLPAPANKSRDKWLAVAASLLVVPFIFYLFAAARGLHQSPSFAAPNPRGFGVVIDAGRASSRVRVFQFFLEGRVPFVDTSAVDSNSANSRPGLPAFAHDPEGGAESVLRLVEFAKQRVPRSEWSATKVQMMVSRDLGGLDSDVKEAMLEACRRVLRASGFLFKDEWAAVMEGTEEGVYAWVAVNYALGTLGQEPQDTTGIVELGGASMQVTFVPRLSPPPQFSRIIKLAGVVYNLYTKSFPQFGQDAAWESLHETQRSRGLASFSSSAEKIASNPCIPRGCELTLSASDANFLMSHPAGNFSACKLDVLTVLKRRQDTCLYPPCRVVSSFFVELQGKPVGPKNFFYTSESFGLVPKASLSELEAAGEHYCEDDWVQLKSKHHYIDDLDLAKYCFSSAYMVALLHYNLGIPMDDTRIGFANHTRNIPLDWTLGAFVLQTMLEPLELEPDSEDQMVLKESVIYFPFFVLLLIAVLATFFFLKLQKPQLRTVYDLEKGRYIVTHLPR